jgi:transitional endoplasmic reticulum ATPase
MTIIVASELYRNRHNLALVSAINNGGDGDDSAHGGFETMSGMNDIKDTLRRQVIDPLHNPNIYKKFKTGPANGILLYGPPGCGKTHVAKALKTEMNGHFITIKIDTVGSKWVHQTSVNIANAFAEAEKKAPCIVFIDELDSLAPKRDGGMRDDDVHSREVVNTLLALVDGCAKKGIIFIGATNDKDHIDPALRSGRMDLKLEIPLPNEETREQLFSNLLTGRPCAQDINVNSLACQTQGYNCADVKTIVEMAARKAAQDTVAARIQNQNVVMPITMESLTQAIRTIASSRR